MLISNPSFLQQPPPRTVAFAVLSALLWTALPLAASLPAAVIAVFGGLWLLRLALLKAGIGRVPKAALLLLAVVAGLLVWQQLGTVFGREGGVAFLLLLVMLKAFEGNSQRDWQVLLLAMLFLIGSSVLLNQSLFIGVWLLLALAAVSVCFAVLCGLGGREAFKRSVQALLLTLPLTVVLFVAVPRLNEPLWRIPQQTQQAKTGLSDTMEPGSISNLVQSDEWVANITFSDGLKPQRSDLYWRAIIMSEFDGTRWQALNSNYIDESRTAAAPERTVAYQMIIRDQNGVLPALDYPTAELPAGVEKRLGQTIRASRSREGLRRLSLQASLSDTLSHALDAGGQNFYTRLPSGNPQTRRLAETLAQQSATPRQFIGKVLEHYRNQNFAYTLQPPRTPGRDGIDEFMFRTRRGFCEHYAQSFVVMMRAAGLPARVVTGYLGADYNEQAGFWQIRAKDAHAWAEVWLPQEQVWLRVDPTAAVSAVRAESGISQALAEGERGMVADSGSLFARWRDTGQFYWQQWVVNYDQTKQNSLFARIGLGGFNWQTLLLVLPAALAAALLPLARWWFGGRNRERDFLNEGFALVKSAVLGKDDETAAAVSAGELNRMLHENGIADPALSHLLQQYEHWLYAAERPPQRTQKRWFAAARKTAKRYGAGRRG
ncbi:transglutaminaseTgpA domain-containing protein [Neisseria dentiae]|uniref:transglutaminase family protein n=2 Tax=Neisseria dentiae TaxID=194197 RepID=UPI0035A0E4EF